MLAKGKMKILIGICLVISSVNFVSPYVFPSVKKCNYTDSNCLKTSFQEALPYFAEGIPELDIPPMDELVIEDKTYQTVGLNYTIRDGRLKGLKSIIFDRVSMDLKNKVISTDYRVKKCKFRGRYEAEGILKALPLKGLGEVYMNFRNVAIFLNVTYDMEVRDGKQYIIPQKYDFDYEVKDHAHFYLSNLFNGNWKLADAVLRFLNDNWREVSRDYGRLIMEQEASQLFTHVVKYMSNSPVDEIFVKE